jgi:uncharacterized MnhB-related membrane protein
MIILFDMLVLVGTVAVAIAALQVKDLLSAAILFGAYSLLLCLMWAQMGAVDVAFTEAAVGAGVATVLFFATVLRTTRRSSD